MKVVRGDSVAHVLVHAIAMQRGCRPVGVLRAVLLLLGEGFGKSGRRRGRREVMRVRRTGNLRKSCRSPPGPLLIVIELSFFLFFWHEA